MYKQLAYILLFFAAIGCTETKEPVQAKQQSQPLKQQIVIAESSPQTIVIEQSLALYIEPHRPIVKTINKKKIFSQSFDILAPKGTEILEIKMAASVSDNQDHLLISGNDLTSSRNRLTRTFSPPLLFHSDGRRTVTLMIILDSVRVNTVAQGMILGYTTTKETKEIGVYGTPEYVD